ncbi:MAG: acyl-CoA dehydrogenase family protein [Polyangiaceae bacterium]
MPQLPDVEELLGRYRRFVGDHLLPFEPTFLGQPFAASMPALRALRETAKEAGLFAPHLPGSLGGLGLPLGTFARVSEILGTTPVGHYVMNCQAPDVGNMELLQLFGTAEQKKTFLEPLARGDVRSCFSMTEPAHAGSNPVVLGTRARRDGDHYVIDGEKWFTSGADGAAFAIVMAVTNPEATKPHERASQILVPTDTKGFVVVENLPIMGERGADYFSHSRVRYEGVRVPVTNRLGDEGAGFRLAQERLGPGRIHHAMRWIGIAERAFSLMCARAATREIGSNEVLASKQIVQAWIAECRADIHAARLMVLDAARILDGEGIHAAREAISLIKFFVARVLDTVLDRAIQTHGALGLTELTPLSFWYRHERGARIYDGPDEVHKSVVARMVLKGYGISSSG